jgi:Acyltransferase family/Ankyrin repeats (3 copies)
MKPPLLNPRRHDLDALRAAAMLLGLAYHAALSFALGPAWMVQDVGQSRFLYVFQAFVHGFRMPLFMVVSGFFTAMLWRQKGLRALIRHRVRRVLVPCLIGLVTVVPAMIGAGSFAGSVAKARREAAAASATAPANVWTAIRKGDSAALREHLKAPGVLTTLHPDFGTTPLAWAALVGDAGMVRELLDAGAPVDGRNRDGGSALHAAAFLGRAEAASLLIGRGADVRMANFAGDTPLRSATTDYSAVEFIAGILGIPVERAGVEQGRAAVVKQLGDKGAGTETPAGPAQPQSGKGVLRWLIETPVFTLVWFLWFLVWLVAIFAGVAALADRYGWRAPAHPLLISPWSLLWLVPLTLVATSFMGNGNGEFGPDTAMGIVPAPHVLGYYAVFFFFGAVYYDADDLTGRLGSGWRWQLPLAMIVVLPVALELATGFLGFRDRLLPTGYIRAASLFLQSLYPWMMTLGCMGLFRALLTRENNTIRYLSDSAYWLYLAHLPLTIVLQALIAGWPLPGLLKWVLLTVFVTGVLLVSYQFLVRYTFIGNLLNGPRQRPGSATPDGGGRG